MIAQERKNVNGLLQRMQSMWLLARSRRRFVSADNFIPIKYAIDGSLLDCILLERRKVNTTYYTRAERHSITSGHLVIQNKAYKSGGASYMGSACSLEVIDEWVKLPGRCSYISFRYRTYT